MAGLGNTKRIAIVGGISTDTSTQTDYKTPLSAYFSAENIEFNDIKLDELVFLVTNESFKIINWTTKELLSDYDFVMIRGRFYENTDCLFALSRYLFLNKIPYFNDYSNCAPKSKLAQSIIFYENSMDFIDTYYSLNKISLIELASNKLQFPLVVKDSFGSHGNNNHIVGSVNDLKNIFDTESDIKFIAQPYCPNDGDFRILVVGDLLPLVIKRVAQPNTHLNNTSQGGDAELAQNYLPQDIVVGSKTIAQKLGMSVAGVDVIEDKNNGKFYFLEINSQPQLVSGVFLEKKIELLSKLFNKSI